MNGMNNPFIFYPMAILIVIFALLTVSYKNIFYSLISAIVVFFLTGIIFYTLGAEYNAVIQIAIYGIAVPIILGIAIMFTNLKNNNSILKNKNKFYTSIIILVSGIFILASIYLLMTSLAINPIGFALTENSNLTPPGIIQVFGEGIFSKYVLAFEIISLILTITVAGITLFRGGKRCLK